MRPAMTYCMTLIAALLAAFLLTACGKPPAAGTPVVGVLTAQPQRVALSTELPRRTVPFLIADVRPQVSGIVKTRNFREGSDVKAGAALYQIDPATSKATCDSNLAVPARLAVVEQPSPSERPFNVAATAFQAVSAFLDGHPTSTFNTVQHDIDGAA